MSNETTRPRVPTGNFISEDAVRGALARRRRRRAPVTATEPQSGVAANHRNAAERASSPAGDARPLRRWSVAELIARAAGPPPRTA